MPKFIEKDRMSNCRTCNNPIEAFMTLGHMPFANGFISRGSFVYGVEHEDSLIHVMLRHQETTIHKITVSFSDAWPDDTKLDKFNGYFGDYPWVRPESFLKRNMLNETMMGHLFWADDHPPK